MMTDKIIKIKFGEKLYDGDDECTIDEALIMICEDVKKSALEDLASAEGSLKKAEDGLARIQSWGSSGPRNKRRFMKKAAQEADFLISHLRRVAGIFKAKVEYYSSSESLEKLRDMVSEDGDPKMTIQKWFSDPEEFARIRTKIVERLMSP